MLVRCRSRQGPVKAWGLVGVRRDPNKGTHSEGMGIKPRLEHSQPGRSFEKVRKDSRYPKIVTRSEN